MTETPQNESIERLPLTTYDISRNLEAARDISDDPNFHILGDALDAFIVTETHKAVCEIYTPEKKTLRTIFKDLIGVLDIADTLISHITDRTFPTEGGDYTVNTIHFHANVAIASDSIAHSLEAARFAALISECLDGSYSRPTDTAEHREEVNT